MCTITYIVSNTLEEMEALRIPWYMTKLGAMDVVKSKHTQKVS